MKALVINVDTATARMDFQHQQLNHLNIEFQRIPAYKINGKKDALFLDYYSTWERPLSTSEVSCFFSHKSSWDLIIKKNVPMLILEDDAYLSEDVPCQLQELEDIEDIDYVNLEARGRNQKKCISKEKTATLCNSSLLRLYQGRSGAAAYVLWPSGAKKLIKKIEQKGIGIADKFINSNYSLLAYQIEPASAIQLDQCEHYGIASPLQVETSIKNVKATVSLHVDKYLKYRLRRLSGEFKVALNQLRNRHYYIRRPISLSDNFKCYRVNSSAMRKPS